jgi:hypothetical protein
LGEQPIVNGIKEELCPDGKVDDGLFLRGDRIRAAEVGDQIFSPFDESLAQRGTPVDDVIPECLDRCLQTHQAVAVIPVVGL